MIPAVELDGVRHRYSSRDEDALAIERPSISQGQRVALVGHSGSGKTTLLRVINGLVRPLTGRVCVLGTDLADPAARARTHRRRVGLVFQEFNLVERLSVYRNVLNGRLGWSGGPASLMGRFPETDRAARSRGRGRRRSRRVPRPYPRAQEQDDPHRHGRGVRRGR